MSVYTSTSIFSELLVQLAESVFFCEGEIGETREMRFFELADGEYKMGPYWAFVNHDSGEILWEFDYAKYADNEDIKGDGLKKFCEYVQTIIEKKRGEAITL